MRQKPQLARCVALIACAIGVLLPARLSAQPEGRSKLDARLQQRAAHLTGQSRVIVQFRTAPDPRVITRHGGVATRRLVQMGAQVAYVDNHALPALAAEPAVARVTPDWEAFPTVERTGAAIGATIVREELGLTGRGIGVAVIDSGVAASHDDLSLAGPGASRANHRVVHSRDFTQSPHPNVWLSERATDDFGHGTHVAGIIAGNGFASNGLRTGVAPLADIVALKVLDAEGRGYISDVIEAIDYAIAVRATFNIRVINISVASGVFESYRTDPLALAARRAVEAGIVVVASAGNLGASRDGSTQFGGITSPGNAPWVLTVGAVSHNGTPERADDTLPNFSSRGPTWIDFAAKPDLVAPGVGIESLAAAHSTLYAQGGEYLLKGTRPGGFLPYLSMSGTSMSAPVVAGTVALMLEVNPDLTPNAVKAILQYTAQVRNEHPLAQGAGLLNTRGAVRMARFFAEPQRGPGPAGDPLAGEWIEWSRALVWGNVRVDGGLPLPGSSAWALDVIWGAPQDAAGRPVVWGANADDNIVWSTSDDNIVWSTGDDNIVWSTSDDNIVWSTSDDNIVWSTGHDNIVWSTGHAVNVVWGTQCGGADCRQRLWGAPRDSDSVWGTAAADDNIVWSTHDDNIVWSTNDDNIVWSTSDDNIVWSTSVDNIVWSTNVDNIVWSTSSDGIPSESVTEASRSRGRRDRAAARVGNDTYRHAAGNR